MTKYKYVKDILTGPGKKYSATKSAGIVVTIIGTLSFGYAVFIKNIEIVQASVWFVSLGAALLGVRNVFQPKKDAPEEQSETKAATVDGKPKEQVEL